MSVDILILNTAVVDLRGPQFGFTEGLVGPGGLAKCPTRDMPPYTQADYQRWIAASQATAGGPGNSAPLLARAGLKVAVGANLGAGDFGGLDAQGRFFHDLMTAQGVDMSATYAHPDLPTGTTYIYDKGAAERGGIAYFPNANNDFDFGRFAEHVERLAPRIVYYMYSGLSDRGDANGGRDLADFIAWCRARGCLTIADSHTLTGNPHGIIESGAAVAEYRLLEPLLPQLDVFFTSCDEALMIVNTLERPRRWAETSEEENIRAALNFIAGQALADSRLPRLCGITYRAGAYVMRAAPAGPPPEIERIESRFMGGEVIDLVGAGDSFRTGVVACLARNLEAWREGKLPVEEVVQMGNLFASLFIKAPLGDRYGLIAPYDRLERVVRGGERYASFDALLGALK